MPGRSTSAKAARRHETAILIDILFCWKQEHDCVLYLPDSFRMVNCIWDESRIVRVLYANLPTNDAVNFLTTNQPAINTPWGAILQSHINDSGRREGIHANLAKTTAFRLQHMLTRDNISGSGSGESAYEVLFRVNIFFLVTTMHSVIKIRYRLIVIYVIVLNILLCIRVLESSDVLLFRHTNFR